MPEGEVVRQELTQENPPAGLSHDEFMALSGLAPVPVVPERVRGNPLPIEYREACKAIATCLRIEEAHDWSDRADVLSAWARMYHEDKIGAEARRLKLHAYRRMDEIADQLSIDWRPGRQRGPDKILGPVQRLRMAGLSDGEAATARQVAQVPKKIFEAAVKRERPPTPGMLVIVDAAACPGWARIKRAASVFNALCRHHPPGELSARLPVDQLLTARRLMMEVFANAETLHDSFAKRQRHHQLGGHQPKRQSA